MKTPALRRLAGLACLAVVPLLAFKSTGSPAVSAEEAVLVRQTQELRTLLAAAERGSLLDFEQVLVVIDQALVQDLLRGAMPLEGPVGNFQVRLESVDAAFGDGLALIHLDGKATFSDRPVSGDFRVYGGLEVVRLDPASGVLRCQVKVYAVEARRADILGVDEPFRGLTEALTQGGLESLLHSVEIPVRIQNAISLPAVASKRVRIGAAEVPIHAQVAGVKVFGGKLWVAISAQAPAPTPAGAS